MDQTMHRSDITLRFSVAATLLVLTAGCHSSTGPLSSLTVSNNADDFTLIAQTFDRGATDALHYVWPHTGTVASVYPCINDPSGVPVCSNITAGTAGVVIKDAAGAVIY